ncbi:MAG TPA: hypothetical protein VKT73_08880 [Xanthobacteraceae bacterium]|jgi:hypothetical protein|nr:hypothetical protein [Xanthobacteraceae bacterium]
MRRTDIEKQRNELIERLRQARTINPRANPLYRKALSLLTRTWMRTPAVRHLGLLKTAMWLCAIADKYPIM